MVLFRNDRQIYVRSTIGLVKYHLQSRDSFCVFTDRIARIHVSVESREIAAGDIYAYAMPMPEKMAYVSKPDDKFGYISRLQQFRFCK
jgi:hypothetical protein